MDIFIRGVTQYCTEKELNEFLKPHLLRFSIATYYLRKMKGKPCAVVTVPDEMQGRNFILHHGYLQDPGPGVRVPYPLFFQRKILIFQPSRNAPQEMDLRALDFEQKSKAKKMQKAAATYALSTDKLTRSYITAGTSCGYWAYNGSELGYVPQYYDVRSGEIVFGRTAAAILLAPSSITDSRSRIDIPYNSVETIVLGLWSNPMVTLTLRCAPKFYQVTDITDMFSTMSLNTNGSIQRKTNMMRTTSMSPSHASIAGSCFVYQLTFTMGSQLALLRQLLEKSPGMPAHITSLQTPNIQTMAKFRTSHDALLTMMQDHKATGTIPFSVKFQMQRLAVNGFLPPQTVKALLPYVEELSKRHGHNTVSECIRRFSNEIEFAGPGVDSQQFEVDELKTSLKEVIELYHDGGSIYDLAKKLPYLALVHRVTITPAGIYLEGPELEVSNRVLRQYKEYSDYFIRVNFADEDGDRLSFESKASNEEIYHERFAKVLRDGFNIAGRQYSFLGFSHSSLRNQTCWFSSPFIHNIRLFHPQYIISQLGKFEKFRSPARCAARIGQAFSDTSGTFTITQDNLGGLKDVERDGRNFSDGCGTISPALLEKVCDKWALSIRRQKPTLLQIRFQGVKGLLSLDNRILGEQLYLRPSMEKFEGSPSWDIEVCGANFTPLPMYLNRQFIKILEDLQVPPTAFLELQRHRVKELRMMAADPVSTSALLEKSQVGTACRLPSLVKLLGEFGISFRDDDFLNSAIEIALLAQLRELKYRARMLVDGAVTLHGIMDETGFLKEGEIYVVTKDREGRKTVISGGHVVITRAPALDPGDIQLVKAVDVPAGSPLSALYNCVVFSQHGSRDLPSQLSGGDLDGDLYNVIWDETLKPKIIHKPADYPRVPPVDIGREVTRNDMSEFFIKFMETDQLGRISTLHLALADRFAAGTAHPDCIKLAELASTAVDFSKTGIPIDLKKIPRYHGIRPDFMAPSPRVLIEEDEAVFEDDPDDNEEDEFTDLDPDAKRMRYYRSDRVLGQLFRDIDERQFLDDIKKQAFKHTNKHSGAAITRLLAYVKKEAALLQWEHYRDMARGFRETYESNLTNSMWTSSPNPAQPLSEVEVFAGSILGKTFGGQSKRIREYTKAMKEDFDRHVAHTIEVITTDDDGSKDEALARSIACLAIGVEDDGKRIRKVGHLKSWKYVAAAVCLMELEKFHGTKLLKKVPTTSLHARG